MIITAPNSLIPRANIITNPEMMLFHANGRLIVKNTLMEDAPRFCAACSNLTGTSLNPSRAEFIRKGKLTNAIAIIMPTGVPTMVCPKYSEDFPINESPEITLNRAIPAAE